jgi:hypothetical protein
MLLVCGRSNPLLVMSVEISSNHFPWLLHAYSTLDWQFYNHNKDAGSLEKELNRSTCTNEVAWALKFVSSFFTKQGWTKEADREEIWVNILDAASLQQIGRRATPFVKIARMQCFLGRKYPMATQAIKCSLTIVTLGPVYVKINWSQLLAVDRPSQTNRFPPSARFTYCRFSDGGGAHPSLSSMASEHS